MTEGLPKPTEAEAGAATAQAAADPAGWQAQLQLRFAVSQGRTCLAQCRHQGPLRIQRIFYPEADAGRARSVVTPLPAGSPVRARALHAAGLPPRTAEPCHVYVVHPPGGLVSGDRLEVHAELERHAHVLLTTPAAGKFYRRRGVSVARAEQELHVDGGALEWLPQENIYYPDTRAAVSTRVYLDKNARFIGWELACMGLPALRASLADGSVRQTLELWVEGQALLLERLLIDGQAAAARWGLAGNAAFGTWLAHPARPEDLEAAGSLASSLHCAQMMLTCTIVDGILCCRGRAQRTDHLKQAFIALWRRLRPALLGRPAVAPRIWAT